MTYTKEQAKQKIKERVELFKENIDDYKKSTYKEAQVREHFINPFFEALGWDVGNKEGLPLQATAVVLEDTIKDGRSTRTPDYSFRIGGQRKFFVEAKKPAVNIKENVSPSYQLRRYAWSAKLPLSILTDFEEFSVFDCRFVPNLTDKPNVHRIKYYTFEDYLDSDTFDEIYDVFSKEAVLKGSFDKYAQSIKGKRGTEEVDSAFLKEIENWRELLAKNIALRNPDVSIYELNYAVQKIIDRIIFLRICEDRGIEPYGQLQTKAESGDVYTHLRNHFKLAESKYDSGIFDFDTDRITPALKIDDRVLKTIIQSLYYPKSPYEFSVLGVEILGNVYEQFLGKVIRLTAGHQAKVETKPEVKKAGGVYYTPQYIVDYIVKNTVGKLVEGNGKTPEEIAAIKILDPACGSGSFLIGAYTYLLQYHLDWYVSNEPKKHKKAVFQVRENEWYLTTAEKKRILLNNIFGVDIDPQAVEVTKLSLLLKVLEHESRESIDQQVKLGLEGVLPNLEGNIKCGNSLIGPDFYDGGQQETLFDEAEMRRVNVFDWNDERKGFGEIMKRGGFDVVIGNPPYVQIQKLKNYYPQETEFYQKKYKTASARNVDIYIPFIERSLQLIKTEGLIGMICPNRFFNSDYGENIRSHLRNFNIYHLVNLRHYFVFTKSDTYTCLLFLQNKKQQEKLTYKEIRDIYKSNNEQISYFLNNAKKSEEHFEIDEILPHFLNQEKWYFMTEDEAKIFEKIIKYPKFKGFYKEFFVGVQTSKDGVYILKYLGETEKEYHLYSVHLDKEIYLEKGIVKPIIDNKSINSYYVIPTKECVIFPYKIEDGKAILYPQRELETKYPKTWEYLKENKQVLENREKCKFKTKEWYKFGRDQNIAKQHLGKILIPHVVKKTVSAIDGKGEFCLDNVGANGIILEDDVIEHPYYFMAILNSPISTFFISKTSIFLSGGFYAANKQFAGEIPIRTIDFSNHAEKAQHDKLVALVESMLELQKKRHETRMEIDKGLYERQIRIVDAQIDRLVYDLYGLTEEEVKVVEGE